MKDFQLDIFLLQLTFVTFVALMLAFFIRSKRSLKYEKKFNKFSFLSIKDTEVSFFDSAINTFLQFVKKISNKLNSYDKYNKICLRYKKFIYYSDKKDEKDIMVIKMLSGVFFWILYLISLVLNIINFNLISFIISFSIGFLVPNILFVLKLRKEQTALKEGIFSAIVILNNALKFGKNMMDAVRTVVNNSEGIIKEEFKKVENDLQLGITTSEAFTLYYKRVNTEDLYYISNILKVLEKENGNVIKVFGAIEQNLYRKQKLHQELRHTLEISDMVYKFLLVLPFIIVSIIIMIKANYFNYLFNSYGGYLLIFIVLVLYTSFVFIVKKVLSVKL